jgi:hypothetical protein
VTERAACRRRSPREELLDATWLREKAAEFAVAKALALLGAVGR